MDVSQMTDEQLQQLVDQAPDYIKTAKTPEEAISSVYKKYSNMAFMGGNAELGNGLLKLADHYYKPPTPKNFDANNSMDAFLAFSGNSHGQDISNTEGYNKAIKWWGTPEGQTAWKDYLKTTGKAGFAVHPTSAGLLRVDNSSGSANILKDESGKPYMPVSADIPLAGGRETAIETAKKEVEKKYTFPKVTDNLNSLNRQWDTVDRNIDKAINEIGPFTTGMGAWMSIIPATPQKNLKETLSTIRANIGFDKLQEMRQSSPTGGALGQVSDFEDRLLQAVQGSLDQSQSPAQLKANLLAVKDNLQKLKMQKALAYQMDYGSMIGSRQPQAQNSQPQTQTQSTGYKWMNGQLVPNQ